jgi:putative redox protein
MPQETKSATLIWQRGLQFTGSATGVPATTIDGDNAAGPGPMLTLLLAAAACTASDVVVILGKMQGDLRELRIDISGTRREEEPRRYVAIHLDYYLSAGRIDLAKARRAIDLSLEKYCSVLHSLAPDIAVTYALTLG